MYEHYVTENNKENNNNGNNNNNSSSKPLYKNWRHDKVARVVQLVESLQNIWL